MKNINISIKNAIGEIIIAILLITLSVPLWKSFEATSYAKMASEYSQVGLNLEVYQPMDSMIYNLDNKSYSVGSEYVVKNYSDQNKNYELILIVSENETSNYEHLYVDINDQLIKLTDLEKYRYSSSNGFTIAKDIVNKYTHNNYDIRLYDDGNFNGTINCQVILKKI